MSGNNFYVKRLFTKNLLFVYIWLLVSFLFQFHKTVFLGPIGIHQGAQADRASIALNYSRVSMNFFKPRVMETGTRNGITPCEFPVMNYTAALCYKIFGVHAFWYRFLMWCLMGFGLWAAFDLLYRWLHNLFAALFIAFTWYFSAVLGFYTPNFLPDTASLSLTLLALRQWFIYDSARSPKRLIWFTLFASLACLIKISSLIYVIALLLLNAYLYFKQKRRMPFIWSCIAIFAGVVSWYLYCQWLQQEVGGTYFLMEIVRPASLVELKEWFGIFYNNWFSQIYSGVQWLLILFGVLVTPFIKEKGFLKPFVYIALLGVAAFFLLMAGQFRYHDYYIICMMPVALIFMGFGFKAIFQWKPFFAYALIFVISIWGLISSKNYVRLRFKPGSYLYQTFYEPFEFEGAGHWLDKNDVTETVKIMAAFDPNPNTLLYMLGRQGYRINDHALPFINEKLDQTKAFVTNDTLTFFMRYPETRDKLVLKDTFHRWQLFKMKK